MILSVFMILAGLVLLVWSADRFVDGAAAAARHAGMSPLLIGMLIIGFGTSAPELLVSATASLKGSSDLSLGNAYGSNIFNIGFILGVTALIRPILVNPQVLRKELPVLLLATAISAILLHDGIMSTLDSWILLAVFAGLVAWSIRDQRRHPEPPDATPEDAQKPPLPLGQAIFWIIAGLALLLVSSNLLVSGATDLARRCGVSDLVIGLTIVAAGTSLPELASSIAAIRKGADDLVIGNIVGSNLFNTLAVVGLAGAIQPIKAGPEILCRDMAVMGGMTLLLVGVGYGFRGRPGRISRREGVLLLLSFVAYLGWLLGTAKQA